MGCGLRREWGVTVLCVCRGGGVGGGGGGEIIGRQPWTRGQQIKGDDPGAVWSWTRSRQEMKCRLGPARVTPTPPHPTPPHPSPKALTTRALWLPRIAGVSSASMHNSS